MYDLTENDLVELKKIELDILIQVDKICRENNINYSLAAGTLLGAIRHSGFIPWDDDIDIMMYKTDYDKFKELLINGNVLDNSYFYLSLETNKKYALPFIKIMKKNTIMIENSTVGSGLETGVWLDVFPIVNTSSDENKKKEQHDRAKKINSALFIKSNYSFGKKGLSLFIYRLRKLRYLFCSRKRLINDYNLIMNKYSNCESEDCILLASNYKLQNITYKKSWFNEYIDVEFENKSFRIIKEYHNCLKNVYGDYMKLPPIEEQKGHHTLYKFDISNK